MALVTWARGTPAGSGALNVVVVKPAPTPSTKSACSRKRWAMSVAELAPVPRESGWLSGKALLPASVVSAGMRVSSTNSISSRYASA